MLDFIFLMHDDFAPHNIDEWGPYVERLQKLGVFSGGSSMGGGVCVNKAGKPVEISRRLVGHIKVRAESLDQAREYLIGNPVFEAGGTVEIRELPKT